VDLNLDRLLESTRNGQWDVDDFDWSAPLEGADGLSKRQKREAGMALAFTAGLERQAARVFALCAEYADDPVAAQIYRLFEADELRHAEAELRLAKRYGVEWSDQPWPVRWMFRELKKNFEPPNRGTHEVSSATIVLFELALDSILIPALKERVNDPLQSQVFRRIDIDESRHLAMDYWLLERKGEKFDGRELADVLQEEFGTPPWRDRARGQYRLYLTMVAFLVGFGVNGLMLKDLRKELQDPKKIAKYLRRVAAIPGKAPLAMKAPAYRMGLKGQRIIMQTMARLTGNKQQLEQLEQLDQLA